MSTSILNALSQFHVSGTPQQQKLKMILWFGCKAPRRTRVLSTSFVKKMKSWIGAFAVISNQEVNVHSILNTINFVAHDDLTGLLGPFCETSPFTSNPLFDDPVLTVNSVPIPYTAVAQFILAEHAAPKVPPHRRHKVVVHMFSTFAERRFEDPDLRSMFQDVAFRCVDQFKQNHASCPSDHDCTMEHVLAAIPRLQVFLAIFFLLYSLKKSSPSRCTFWRFFCTFKTSVFFGNNHRPWKIRWIHTHNWANY